MSGTNTEELTGRGINYRALDDLFGIRDSRPEVGILSGWAAAFVMGCQLLGKATALLLLQLETSEHGMLQVSQINIDNH